MMIFDLNELVTYQSMDFFDEWIEIDADDLELEEEEDILDCVDYFKKPKGHRYHEECQDEEDSEC